jgi:hypothetical protein
MTREALDMNRKKEDAPRNNRVDAKILGFNPNQAKVAKGVTLDAETLNEHVI